MDTDLDLKDKVIIVTGASGGIGKSTADFLMACGAIVVRSDLEKSLENDNQNFFIKSDVSKLEEVENLFEQTISRYKTLYGVVHCGAVIIRQKNLNMIDINSLEKEIHVNQIGTFFVARKALNVMLEKKDTDGGRIVIFSSQGAFTGGFIGSITYAMTKASLTALTKSFARIGAPRNITVNQVAPGAIDTPMMRNDVSEKDLENFKNKILLSRFGQPKEVASVCAFLLSSWSSYISGDTIHVNGGQYMP